jgi:hypothetical protein
MENVVNVLTIVQLAVLIGITAPLAGSVMIGSGMNVMGNTDVKKMAKSVTQL